MWAAPGMNARARAAERADGAKGTQVNLQLAKGVRCTGDVAEISRPAERNRSFLGSGAYFWLVTGLVV